MSTIYSVRFDRKTGEIISCTTTPSNEKINHKPLIDYLYNRMIESVFVGTPERKED